MRILDANRRQYNKKIIRKKSCEFCSAANIRRQSCPSLESEHWRVWVNKYPYLDGNLMIIPKRHVTAMADLSEKEWDGLRQTMVKTQARLKKIFHTDAFNIGLNQGLDAGASISHMHWQIIPRHRQNLTVMNLFSDLYLISVSPDDLKEMIEKKS